MPLALAENSAAYNDDITMSAEYSNNVGVGRGVQKGPRTPLDFKV